MKMQNKRAERDPLLAPSTNQLKKFVQRFPTLFIVIVGLVFVAQMALFASTLFAQNEQISVAGGETLVVDCEGRGFRVERISRTRLSLECSPVRGGTTPQPTATAVPTDLPPTATPIPPTDPTATPQPQPTTPPSGNVSFLSTFDGDPASPLPWTQVSDFSNWDVTVHRRSTSLTMQGIQAHHGPNCEPPTENTHYNDTYEGAVFLCKNHVMTAVNDDGYGVIYLTPNQILDFSNGQEAVVRFDMSTLKTSSRDWVNIWISPYDEHLQLPLEFNVDLQGPPRNAIQIDLSPEMAFIPTITRNGSSTKYQFGANGVNWWVGYDDFFTPDARQRQTFELRISQTRLKFCMPDHNFCWIDMPLQAPLTWDQGIIQFGHHSYTPTKDNSGTPNTWHWDNFEIENGIPFTIIKSDRRYVDSSANMVQLNQPAPAGAHLRFAAIGQSVEVSFDGGATWQAAQKNPQGNDRYHFSSYWTPIPAGSTQVLFRASGGGWQARDITVWAR